MFLVIQVSPLDPVEKYSNIGMIQEIPESLIIIVFYKSLNSSQMSSQLRDKNIQNTTIIQ